MKDATPEQLEAFRPVFKYVEDQIGDVHTSVLIDPVTGEPNYAAVVVKGIAGSKLLLAMVEKMFPYSPPTLSNFPNKMVN